MRPAPLSRFCRRLLACITAISWFMAAAGTAWAQAITWTAQTSGGTEQLRDVWAADATNIWIVGNGGAILKGDGSGTWTPQASGVTNPLIGLWGTDSTNVWAVGGSGRILSWNGSTWATQTSGTTDSLFCVWGTDASNIWAAGQFGTFTRWNGTSWTSGFVGLNITFTGMWGSAANQIWMVGTRASGGNGGVYKYNGTSWSEDASMGVVGGLNDVWGSSATDVWAVGNSGLILRWNGTSWSTVSSGTTQNLQAVWGTAANNIYATGHQGGIFRYDGSTWAAQASGTTQRLNSVVGTSTSSLYAVGGSFSFAQLLVGVPESVPTAEPTVTTTNPGTIGSTTVVMGGNVTADGGGTVLERGIVWGIAPNPTTANNKFPIGSGTGVFSGTVTGLPPTTTVFARAFARNSLFTGYGTETSFVTLSNNADLSALTTTAGALTPPFVSSTTSYTASVPNATTSITVTPTVADANATVTVNSVPVTSGTPSGSIALNIGSNAITTVVTAQDSTTTKTYTLTVTRAAPMLAGNPITPTDVLTTSQWVGPIAGVRANMINGTGLSGGGSVLTQTHDELVTANTIWHAGPDAGGISGGVTGPPPFGAPLVNTQAVEFDLGANYDLSAAHIWNMNQAGNIGRGVKDVQILVSSATTGAFTALTTTQFSQGTGAAGLAAQVIPFTGASNVRRVRFSIQTAWSGAASEYVGLSEVRFQGTPFTVTPPPTLISVSPAMGGTAGGTEVVLTGTNFTAPASVTFDGIAATNVSVFNAQTITCTTPAGSVGTASVLVTTPGGTNAANSLFTYAAPGEINVIPMIAQNFGTQRTGVASFARSFTIENLDNAPLTLSSVALTGGNTGDFQVSTTDMLTVVPAFGSTTFTVAFKPTADGPRSSTLRISSNDMDEADVDIPLSGVGSSIDPPVIAAAPTKAFILSESASLGGNITAQGGGVVTERGIVLALTSTTSNPYIDAPGTTKVVASVPGGVGSFSAAVTGLINGGTYTFRAYALNAGGVSYSNADSFTTPPSNNADLSALAVSTGTLSPAFSAAETAYTMNVANTVTSLAVTPTHADARSTIQVRAGVGGFVPITSGTTSAAMPLNVGENVVAVLVTAEDRSTRTYTITVTRAASTNAGLAALTTSTGTLSPAFAANHFAYTSSVANTITSISLTPTVAQAAAKVSVNRTPVFSGAATAALPLNIGPNTFSVLVTAEDGTTQQTYTITVTRGDFPNTAPSFVIPTAAGGVLGVVWTPRLSDANREWRSLAQSADGLRIVACVAGGSLWTSADAGVTWTERSAAGRRNWGSVCSSADGTKLAAADIGGKIWTSANSGVTWIESTKGPTGEWGTITCDSTGLKLYASNHAVGGSGFTSTNHGTAWTARPTIGRSLYSASSADGNRLASFVSGGFLRISSNGGTAWTNTTFNHPGMRDLAMSADGSRIYCAVANGRIFLSSNNGTSFNAVGPEVGMQSVTCSSDGTRAACLSVDGIVYTSTNSGVTWIPTAAKPAGHASAVRMSGNGSRLVTYAADDAPKVIQTSSLTTSSTQTAQAGDPVQTAMGFVTSISPGTRASEATQTVSFNVTNTNNALFSVQPAIAADGTLTFTPAATGAGSATVSVIAQDNGGTAGGGVNSSPAQAFTITITPRSNLDLAALTISAGTLTPAFAAATTSYTVTVPSSTTSVTLTPTLADTVQRLSVNGSTHTSGAASSALPISPGENSLTVTVSNADGTRTQVYTVVATRTPVLASITQTSLTNLSAITASLSATLGSDGGSDVTEFGFVYALTSANPDPTLSGTGVTQVISTVDSFTADLEALTENSGYSFKAYAINSVGTAYSAVRTFRTPVVTRPEIVTAQPVASLTAGGGSITLNGRYLTGTTAVTIGGIAATAISVIDDATLTATIPAGTAGVKDISITTPIGSTTVRNGFRYADLFVTTSNDSGPGSLRQALVDAADMTGPDTINFSPALSGQTVAFSPTKLAGTENESGYVIDDLAGVTIDASTLPAGLTLTRGNTSVNGRAFHLRTGSLTLKAMTFRNCGGEFVHGGAIYSTGALFVDRCTLAGNSSGGANGGAIYNDNGSVVITQSTLSDNVGSSGGAIYNDGALTLRHCTIANNNAGIRGGGIQMEKAMTIENSIVAGNTARLGGDIYNSEPLTRVGTSIVPSLLHASAGLTGSGSILIVDPLLTGLAANGGPTRTMGLQSNSPAIHAAVGSAITSDQRGSAVSGIPDIGAFELQPSAPVLGLASSTLITGTSASLGGLISSNGGAALSERGIVYALTSANPNPEIGGGGVTKVIVAGSGTGSFSTPVSGLTPGAAYSFRAYAINALGTSYTPPATFTTLSNNANLSTLELSIETLTPAFNPATTIYTANVGNSVDLLSLTPTAAQTGALVRINNLPAIQRQSLPLNTGANVVNLLVTAPDGTTTKTYTLTITRAAGTPTLERAVRTSSTSSAAVIAGKVSNSGGSNVTEQGVVFSLLSVNRTPAIGGTGVTKVVASSVSGSDFTANLSGLAGLSGYAFRTYATNSAGSGYSATEVFTTTSANADLSSIVPTTGTLLPAFAPGTLTYGLSTASSSINFTPTLAGQSSVAMVNGEVVGSGTSSRPITLTAGINTVTILVTAQDGETTKTYTIAVSRASGPPVLAMLPTKSGLTSSSATLGGEITGDNGGTITERGVIYSLTTANADPEIGGTGVTQVPASGTSISAFTTPVSGLTASSAYTFKAYAINSAGRGYSQAGTFTTGNGLANVQPSFTLPPEENIPGGVTWTQVSTAPANLYALDVADDGAKLIAGSRNGIVKTSSDGGTTWTDLSHTLGTGIDWRAVTISNDGLRMYGSADLQTTHFLVRWTKDQTTSAVTFKKLEDQTYYSYLVASPDSGQGFYAAATDGGGSKIYRSINGGDNFTYDGDVYVWRGLAASSTSQNLVGAALYPNRRGPPFADYLYVSKDSGGTWTQAAGTGEQYWNDVTISGDGKTILGCAHNGALWLSKDAAATPLVPRLDNVGRLWSSVAASEDGRALAAAVRNGKIWTSSDGGEEWTEQSGSPTGTPGTVSGSGGWGSLRYSADGRKLYAVERAAGTLHVSEGVLQPHTITVRPGTGLITRPNFVTSISAGAGEPNQTVTFQVTTDNDSLFRILPRISANGTLSFTPGIMSGQATVTVRAQDDGGGDDTSAPQTFIIRIPADDNLGTWSTASWADDSTSGISANRSLWAWRFGEALNANINNVSVTATSATTSRNAEFDLTGPTTKSQDTNYLTAGAGGSAFVARDFIAGANPLSLTIKGLIPANEYVLTFLTVGAEAAGQRLLHFSSGTDAIQVDQSQFGDNGGLRVEYTFTADKPTRTITVVPANETNKTFHLYGLALRTAGVDVNHEPSEIVLSSASIEENSAAFATVGKLSTIDADAGQWHNYTLVAGAGDTDNAVFSLQGDLLRIIDSPDYESRTSYSIRVRSTDSGLPPMSVESNLLISVTDVDEPPLDITLSPASIAENNAPEATIGLLRSPGDPEGRDLIFQLVPGQYSEDNASFVILETADGSVLAFNNKVTDYETKPRYFARVRCGTGSGALEKVLTINITNVDEPPTLEVAESMELVEDGPGSFIPITLSDPDTPADRLVLTATFPRGDELIPASNIILGGFGGSFGFSRSLIVTKLTPNLYGSQYVYLTVSDGQNSVEKLILLNVAAVNDAPTFTIPTSVTARADEGAQVISNFATELSGGPNEIYDKFEFVVQSTNPELFTAAPGLAIFDIGYGKKAGNLYFTPVPTARGTSTVTVTLKDDGGTNNGGQDTSRVQTFRLVLDNNRPPVVSFTGISSFAENNAKNLTLGTLSVTDPDFRDKHTYSLVPAADGSALDNSQFKLTVNTLTLLPVTDFETKASYTCRIRATDSGTPNASGELQLTFAVTNANEPPTDIIALAPESRPGAVPNTIPENSGPDQPVSKLTAKDPEPGQSFTWSFANGPDNSLFKIVGDELQTMENFDFETRKTASIQVRATDSGQPPRAFDKDLTITILDRNDPPTDITLSGNRLTLPEAYYFLDPQPGFTAGYLSGPGNLGLPVVTDPDAGSTFTVEMLPLGDHTSFHRNPGGTIVFRGTQYSGRDGIADFESPKKSYSLFLRATDNGLKGAGIKRSLTKEIIIPITNVIEGPYLSYITLAQKLGSKFVDINYSLNAPDNESVNVVVEGSSNGGLSWDLPMNSLTGAFGTVPGSMRDKPRISVVNDAGYDPKDRRLVTWNAGADWNEQFSDTVKIRVRVGTTTVESRTPGPNEGKLVVDTRGDGPLMVSGRILNKNNSLPWAGVVLTIGTRSATTGSNGRFEVRNAAPGLLTTSHPDFVPVKIDVDLAQGSQNVWLSDIALTTNREPPVVNFFKLPRADGVVLAGFGVKSAITANISWNMSDFQHPDYFQVFVKVNDEPWDTVKGVTSHNFTSKVLDIDKLFKPSLSLDKNTISIQVKNPLGNESAIEIKHINVVALPNSIESLAPKDGKEIFTDGTQAGAEQMGFDFGQADFNYTINNRLIGKWGIAFGMAGSFDYTINDANWELAYRGGDQGLFGKQTATQKFFARPELPESAEDETIDLNDIYNPLKAFEFDEADRGRIALFLGDRVREVAFFARANGTVKAATGFGLPDFVEGALIHAGEGPIAEINVLEVLGFPKKIAENFSPTLTISASTGFGGSAKFATVPTPPGSLIPFKLKLRDATLQGHVDLRASLEIGGSFLGAGVYIGAKGYSRFGYPAPLLREIDLSIYAGYEWWIGFLEGGGHVVLAGWSYQSSKDPAAASQGTPPPPPPKLYPLANNMPPPAEGEVGFSLPPVYVKSSQSRGVGPMNRRWRHAGPETFLLSTVAAPSPQMQVIQSQAGKIAATSPIIPSNRALSSFNRMGRPEDIQAKIIHSDPLPAQALLPLLENVYPKSSAAMAERDGKIMLTYTRDTGAANPYHFTEIAYTYYNGTSWSTPGPIAADPRGQTAPQVEFDGNGNVVAVWTQLKDLNWAGNGDLQGQSAMVEIFTSTWSAATGAWSAPVPITNNRVLDHQIALAGPLADGDLMLTWVRNNGNLLSGTADSPDELITARWDSATQTWSPATLAVSGITGTLTTDFTARDDKAVFAFTRDEDGDVVTTADTELWYIPWTAGNWGVATRVTSDEVADAHPRLAIAANGTIFATWQNGTNIVMEQNFSGTRSIVREDSQDNAFADYALTLGPDGDLLIIWCSTEEGQKDAFFRLFDSTSATWSSDVRLSNDADNEHFFIPKWDSMGNLVIAYHNTELITSSVTVQNNDGTSSVIDGAIIPGRTDLLVARKRLISDLTIKPGSLTAEATVWSPGSVIPIKATLLNSGDLPVNNATISFYDGDPATGGTLITTSTAPGFLTGAGEFEVKLDWTLPANSSVQHEIYAVADASDSLVEYDESNNKLSLPVGGADLKLEYLNGNVLPDGSFRVIVRITNAGSAATDVADLKLWNYPERGTEAMSSVTISSLAAGENMEMALDAPAGTLMNGERDFEVIVNEDNITAEPNQGNNRSLFNLRGSLAPSGITGLADLAISGSTLDPTFATSTTAYITSVPYDQVGAIVVPTALHFGSTIKVNGAPVFSGQASEAITLNSGTTQIVVEVTSENGLNKITYTVDVRRSITSLTDSGAGSLRALITAAALRGGSDVIAIPLNFDGQSIRLTSPIVIDDVNGLVIDGSGLQDGITIEGAGGHRLFEVSAGSNLTLISVTLKNGGGSTFASNGGAIRNNGLVRIERSTILDSAAVSGGAIHNTSTGTLEILSSTFADNTATSHGGAIFNEGTASVVFSTLSTNLASGNGGAIRSTGTLEIGNSILAGNSAVNGGDLDSSSATKLTYLGMNIVRSIQAAAVTPTGTAPLTSDPLLSELGDYGGTTPTFVPRAGSPAIDQALISATDPEIDQRGYPRRLGGHPDLGSVEGHVLIVNTAQDELDEAGILGSGYSLREAVRDVQDGGTILFDRAVFNGSTATTNTITLTKGPLNAKSNCTLDGTQNPGGMKVITALSIATQPQPKVVAEGTPVSFSIAANAISGGVRYQWRREGADLAGEVGTTYRIGSATTEQADVYDVLVSEAESEGELALVAVELTRGEVSSQPFSLTVGDSSTSIIRQPLGSVIAMGSSFTFDVLAVGPTTPAMTYQWTKDGKAILGATRSNFIIVNAALTHAGAYTCVVKSGTTTITSGSAQIAVVDTTPRSVNALVGGTFTPKISAAGNSLTYAWKRDTTVLTPTTASFILKPLATRDEGLYTCTVTGPAGSLENGFNTRLTLSGSVPTLTPVTLPEAYIGQSYYYKLSALPIAGAPAASFAAKGLPAGITLNAATGVISGRPTATKLGGYAVSFTAINAKGTSLPVNASLMVVGIDSRALGTFAGPAPRSPLNNNLGGRLDLTTTSTGTFSGSVTLGTRAKIAFTNQLLLVSGAGDQVLTGRIPGITMADKTPLAALVEVFVADQTARLTLTHPNGTQLVIPAWRNPWSKTAPATSYTTSYSLRLDAGQRGAASPDGYGFASFSIGADGIVKLTGKLPDGNAITAGGFVGSRGQVLVFQTLYKNAGSLVGQFDITRASPVNTNSLAGALTWSKPLVATDTLYKNGFSPISVNVEGSAYVRPAAGQRLLGLPASNSNAVLNFRLGGLSESWSQLITIANPSATGLTNTATVPPTAVNSLKMTRLDAATGGFVGSFILAGATPVLNRPAPFEGMIVRIDGFTQGYGFFLLPKVPVGAEKVTTSPKLSGIVELRAP
jgi:hypothetical protein